MSPCCYELRWVRSDPVSDPYGLCTHIFFMWRPSQIFILFHPATTFLEQCLRSLVLRLTSPQMSDYPRSQVPDGLGLWQEAGQVRVQPLRLQFNPQKNDGRKRDERKDKMIVCVGASSSMSVLSIYIQVSRNSPPDLSRQGLMEKETNAFKSCVGDQRFYRLLEYSEEKPRDSFWKCMYMAAVRAV